MILLIMHDVITYDMDKQQIQLGTDIATADLLRDVENV